MRVLRHVPYEGGSDFEPLSEDDEFFGAAETADDQAETDNDNIDDIPE